MRPLPSLRPGTLPFVIGGTLLMAACTSAPSTQMPRAAGAGERVVLHEGQYKEVTFTGSNIATLVSKEPIAHPLPQASEIITLSPEVFSEMVRRGDVLSRR